MLVRISSGEDTLSDLPVLAGVIPAGAVATPVSLRFSADCTEEQFGNILYCLCDVATFSYDYLPTYLGDAMNHGERVWGETYAQYVAITGRRVELLRDYAWVTSAVPEAIRHPQLRYGHYKAVAAVKGSDERESLRLRAEWLRRAVEERWTVEELRLLIKEGALPPEGNVLVSEKASLRQVILEAIDYARRGQWDDALRVLEEAVGR